jgi:hypothetical protein
LRIAGPVLGFVVQTTILAVSTAAHLAAAVRYPETGIAARAFFFVVFRVAGRARGNVGSSVATFSATFQQLRLVARLAEMKVPTLSHLQQGSRPLIRRGILHGHKAALHGAHAIQQRIKRRQQRRQPGFGVQIGPTHGTVEEGGQQLQALQASWRCVTGSHHGFQAAPVLRMTTLQRHGIIANLL